MKLIALKLTGEAQVPFDELDPDKLYYSGVNPTVGMIIAEEHTPGENWLFQIGDRVIEADDGFSVGTTVFSYSSSFANDWHVAWETAWVNGFWMYHSCENQPVALIGTCGAQWEEVLTDWQNMIWVEVPIPKELGHFFGYAHAVGEVWTVGIDGKQYSAEAQSANPGARPPVAPGSAYGCVSSADE